MKVLLQFVPFFILIVAPLGVAGQNIGLGVALAATLLACFFGGRPAWQELKNIFTLKIVKQFIVLWCLLITPIILATVARGAAKDAQRLFFGYLYCGLIPCLGVFLANFQTAKWLKNAVVWVLVVMGLVALSQMVFPWKFEGGEFVATIARSRGFYSHPLTFAYAILVVAPWSIAQIFAQKLNLKSAAIFLSVLAIVLTSQSVTVICLYAALVFLAVLNIPEKNLKYKLLTAILIAGAGVVVFPNSVSNKIKTVLSGQRGDRETPYADDRLAFWHAHWEMFKDAPVLGHGTGLEAEDRAPFYEKIGLGSIERKYEAHNMFLQYAVEGGVIALAAFVAIFAWVLLQVRSIRDLSSWEKFYLYGTPLAFFLGGITQNSFQDSEVRFVFLMLLGVLFWRANKGSAQSVN